MRPPVLLLALLAVACTTQTNLAYSPPAEHRLVPRPVIAAVRVTDERGVPDRSVGAVMGIYGRPLKRIETPGPTADEVAAAFHDALAARGDLAPAGAGRYDLDVTMLGLDAEQWAERQGQADLLVRLIERATGRAVYSARTYTESRGDNYLAVDNFEFGSPAALGRVANVVLDRAIDDSLNRSGFVLALR